MSGEAGAPAVFLESDGEGDPNRYWASLEYLLWWIKPVCLKPSTLTLGSPADPVPGAIGQPHTQAVLGNHKFEFGGLSGMRPSLGMWLTRDHALAVEVEGIVLERGSASEAFFSAPSGGPASYIPFLTPGNEQQALPFSIPGVVVGSTTAVGSSRLWGVESNLSAGVTAQKGNALFAGTLLAGFRYLDLSDEVVVTNVQSLVADPSSFAMGAANFSTRNQFYGGQLGARLGATLGRWSADYTTKMAVGETHQSRQVIGQPILAASTANPLLLPGPFLALPSNVGRATSDRVTLIPEVSCRVRYRLTDHVNLSLGYGLLYWNKVLCPGDQMDPHVNVTQLPFHGPFVGSAVPAPQFIHTDFFAHGLDAGIQVGF